MINRPSLVVIPCGARKLPRPAPARELYTGPYFRSCRAAAQSLRPLFGWLILSALHGLVQPDTVLAPYGLRMGEPGSVDVDQLRRQAMELEVDEAGALLHPVVVFGGRAYVAAARKVWPWAIAPLAGPLGAQRSQLAAIARTGDLDAAYGTVIG